jgi:hypothetical protein
VFYGRTEATPEQIAAGIETQATGGRSLWKSISLDQQPERTGVCTSWMCDRIQARAIRRCGEPRS